MKKAIIFGLALLLLLGTVLASNEIKEYVFNIEQTKVPDFVWISLDGSDQKHLMFNAYNNPCIILPNGQILLGEKEIVEGLILRDIEAES